MAKPVRRALDFLVEDIESHAGRTGERSRSVLGNVFKNRSRAIRKNAKQMRRGAEPHGGPTVIEKTGYLERRIGTA